MKPGGVGEQNRTLAPDGFDPFVLRNDLGHLFVSGSPHTVLDEKFWVALYRAFAVSAGSVGQRPRVFVNVGEIDEEFEDQMVFAVTMPELRFARVSVGRQSMPDVVKAQPRVHPEVCVGDFQDRSLQGEARVDAFGIESWMIAQKLEDEGFARQVVFASFGAFSRNPFSPFVLE